MVNPVVSACIGILYDSTQQAVLLSCRPAGKPYAGYWEFPGGKLEVGEDSFLALIRELNEELGIKVIHANMQFLKSIQHSYSHGLVKLDIILVNQWQGAIKGAEGQELEWVSITKADIPSPALPTTSEIFELLQRDTFKHIYL